MAAVEVCAEERLSAGRGDVSILGRYRPSRDCLRIAVVAACPFPFERGTPTRILRTSEALAARGHDVHVVTYHLGDRSNVGRLTMHRIRDLPTYRRTAPGPTWQKLLFVDLVLARRLRSVLQHTSFDLIHAHHFEGLAVAALARGSIPIPIIYDAHTMLASELAYYRLGLAQSAKQRVGSLLDRQLPKVADAVVAVSEEIRTSLARSVGPDVPLATIPNGVEFEHFAAQAKASRADGQLIYAGNLAAYQRIDLMLESFRRVLQSRPQTRLTVVLNEPTGPLEALARRVGVRGALDLVQADFKRLPAVLASAPIALNPRVECDGLPQKLLNYMAAGHAIVSFVGSAKHLHHDQTALVVDNDDVEGFTQAIISLLDDPERARRLGEAARALALSRFSWSHAAQQIEQFYSQTLARAKTRRAVA